MVAAKQRTGRTISVVVPQQSQRKDLRALPVWRRPHWRVRRDLPDGLRRLVGPAGNERDVLLWLQRDLASLDEDFHSRVSIPAADRPGPCFLPTGPKNPNTI